jgi:argininosuccinate lyase
MDKSLQWGGRFGAPPDSALLAYGSSLEDDLVLAPFDVRCSLAHVAALRDAGIVDRTAGAQLEGALAQISREIASGAFAAYARENGAEDIHGAIDARVRDLAPDAGDRLHSGRSRNDQVATTLRLYAAERMERAEALARRILATFVREGEAALAAEALVAATTHWQPAQPVLLAFWLGAAAQPFVRALNAFSCLACDAMSEMPLGSAAVAGSTLELGRESAARVLGFERLSANAMDAIGTRDVLLDAAHALVRALAHASRVSEELILWCTPQFGYAKLGDAASTGSSLMPQKRNPDPFELVRGAAGVQLGAYAGAVASTCGLALSYHRDLQQTKAAALRVIEESLAALAAFAGALEHVSFDYERMGDGAGRGFTVATDVADALIEQGVTARQAHTIVGEAVARAEREGREFSREDLAAVAARANLAAFSAPLTPLESVRAKATSGSTSPASVRAHLQALRSAIGAEEGLP